MHADVTPVKDPLPQRIAGYILSGLGGLLLLVGGTVNIIQPANVVEQSKGMGFDQHVLLPLGIVTVLSTILYLIPRTAIWGAILLTGYLGGAVCTHIIHKDPLGQVLFPVVFGVVIWGGLALRDPNLRRVLFWRT